MCCHVAEIGWGCDFPIKKQDMHMISFEIESCPHVGTFVYLDATTVSLYLVVHMFPSVQVVSVHSVYKLYTNC